MPSVSLTIAALLPVLPIAADALDVGLTENGTVIEAASVPAGSHDGPNRAPDRRLSGRRPIGRDRQAGTPNLRSHRNRIAGVSVFWRFPSQIPTTRTLAFPPVGIAYRDNPESHALWRWIAIQAPDLVLIVGNQDFGLADALSQNAVAGIGRIPARLVHAQPGILKSVKDPPRSEARQEIDRRLSRTPRQLAAELAQYYGHDFDQPAYIQAIALIGQLRLGHQADVERLVSPFVDGSKDSLAKPTGPAFAGHLVFAELADRTHDPRYLGLVRRTADLGFTRVGRNERIDAPAR